MFNLDTLAAQTTILLFLVFGQFTVFGSFVGYAQILHRALQTMVGQVGFLFDARVYQKTALTKNGAVSLRALQM